MKVYEYKSKTGLPYHVTFLNNNPYFVEGFLRIIDDNHLVGKKNPGRKGIVYEVFGYEAEIVRKAGKPENRVRLVRKIV